MTGASPVIDDVNTILIPTLASTELSPCKYHRYEEINSNNAVELMKSEKPPPSIKSTMSAWMVSFVRAFS